MQEFINGYKNIVDAKYNTLICRFARKLSHPMREVETELGNLIADIFAENAELDVAFIGSGSIRSKELGPVLTLGDLKQAFPYDDSYSRYLVSGHNFAKSLLTLCAKAIATVKGNAFR